MIQVNLIPPEHRRKERTPLGQFLAILVAVTLSGASIAGALYVEFGKLREVNSRRDRVVSELQGLMPDARYADALDTEKGEYTRRNDTILEIGRSRVLWSKKFDELWDVVYNRGNEDRHLVWLTKLTCASPNPSPGRRWSDGKVFMAGFSGTDKLQRLSDFHADLKGHELFKDFYYIDNPSGSVQEFTDGREPKAAWKFDLEMKMKAPETPATARGKGAKGAAKPAPARK